MIDAIRARHVPAVDLEGDYRSAPQCSECLQPWGPTGCDTATVLAALDENESAREWLTHGLEAAEAREAALRAALRGHHENGVCSIADPT